MKCETLIVIRISLKKNLKVQGYSLYMMYMLKRYYNDNKLEYRPKSTDKQTKYQWKYQNAIKNK